MDKEDGQRAGGGAHSGLSRSRGIQSGVVGVDDDNSDQEQVGQAGHIETRGWWGMQEEIARMNNEAAPRRCKQGSRVVPTTRITIDEAHADALASVVSIESACWDEDVAAFETDPNNWEDQINNTTPTVVSDDKSDHDTAQEHEPPPSLKDATTALHVLREWNKQFNCGVDSSLHELARAIGVACAKAPNGTLDDWLNQCFICTLYIETPIILNDFRYHRQVFHIQGFTERNKMIPPFSRNRVSLSLSGS
ncbi:hypothetical protein Ae201684P_020001 [Aphanomyces euteiches]|uniref:Uncharacterized protein n=1 Tax=Aphanomyces euteiches TaxID=100861 RepID=A0A6G0XE34_9STRA|nr:hypothetical protein Ae201684_005675 [Aphanomyces euteiches]KAH9078938.1 hypothetical protein Ae201684P_020001 [Aphanomyces euteiches]